MLVEQEKDFQQLAHARVLRAETAHSHPKGFDTEIVCMGDIEETKVACDVLPEWHVEQLDGKCFHACRPHAVRAILLAKEVPLDSTGVERSN